MLAPRAQETASCASNECFDRGGPGFASAISNAGRCPLWVKSGGEPFAGGRRQTTAIVANGGACRADRAPPIEVAYADRQNLPGPSRARFAAVDGGRRCCGAV